jgi:hypothetical protein
MEAQNKEEKIPIGAPLQVVDSRTLSKGFGWWAACVLVESWGRRQLEVIWQCFICAYIYVDSRNKRLSVCPRCRSYNEKGGVR